MELLWIVISISAKIRITASFCSETPLLFTFSAIKMLKIDICYLFITWRTDKALKVCCALIKFQARNPNEQLGKTFFLRSLFFSLSNRVFYLLCLIWHWLIWLIWFGIPAHKWSAFVFEIVPHLILHGPIFNMVYILGLSFARPYSNCFCYEHIVVWPFWMFVCPVLKQILIF